jgi:glutathione S-transferase
VVLAGARSDKVAGWLGEKLGLTLHGRCDPCVWLARAAQHSVLAATTHIAPGKMLAHLPKDFAAVPAALVLSTIALTMMGGNVMKGRKLHGVEYPNMYASIVTLPDGKVVTNAKDVASANTFNCIQRGHQNALESAFAMMTLTVVSGLAYPKTAALGLVLWSTGAYIYSVQYARGDPAKRNNGVALIKYVGLLTLLVSNLAMSYQLYTR